MALCPSVGSGNAAPDPQRKANRFFPATPMAGGERRTAALPVSVLQASGAYRSSLTSFQTPATASRAALAISPLSLAIVVRRKPIRIMRAA
jgi:hypothetical protein